MKKKETVKINPQPSRPTFGVNPMDPWSAKANIAENELEESAGLDAYLKSKGMNPKFVARDTKISISKSPAYRSWQQSHQIESVDDNATPERLKNLKSRTSAHTEIKTAPVKSTKTRIQEARKTAKEKFAKAAYERSQEHKKFMDSIKDKPHGEQMKAMMDKIKSNLNKEEVEQIDEISKKTQASYAAKSMQDLGMINDFSKRPPLDDKDREKQYQNTLSRKANNRENGLHRVMDRMSKEDVELDEANITHAAHFDDPKTNKWASMALITAKNDDDAVSQAHDLLRTDAYRKYKLSAVEKHEPIKNIKMKEETFADAKAADPSVMSPGEGIAEKMTTAQRVKSIHKKLKEEMYDHEKADKSVVTYGKKPKFEKAEKDEGGEKKPSAAAILTGGKTLTGQPRDTVELDPLMRNRPNQPDVTKKDDKKDGKKEDKKKDK